MNVSSLQSEMKLFGEADTETLKQHFGKRLIELEDEKRAVQVWSTSYFCIDRKADAWFFFNYLSLLQQERDRLLAEIETLAASSDGQTQKMQDVHSQKLKALEAQVGVDWSLLCISFYLLPWANYKSFTLHRASADFGSEKETRKPGSAIETKTKKWRSSQAVARGDTIHKGTEG